MNISIGLKILLRRRVLGVVIAGVSLEKGIGLVFFTLQVTRLSLRDFTSFV